MFYVFNTLVKPILNYGSDVWGVNNIGRDTIDRVAYQFIKNVLGVKRSTSTTMVLGESGVLPHSIDCKRNTVNFLNRIVHMDGTSLVRQVYDELYWLHVCGFPTWCSKVLDLVAEYKLDVNLSPFEFKKRSKEIIVNDFKRKWTQQVTDVVNNPILRTYCTFKFKFGMEPYLEKILEPNLRKALSRLRTSSHALRIETARHDTNVLPVDERLCKFCQVIEDEEHFLIRFKMYTTERENMYNSLLSTGYDIRHLSDEEQFVFLLTHNDPHHLQKLSKFVDVCFNKRISNSNAFN